jgi:MoaA/NifB/PqqE/SkfB family radical SAM enzyme
VAKQTPMNSLRAQQVAYISKQLGEATDTLLEFPRYINVETINMCNARCIMCGIDFDNRVKKVMSEKIFAKILDEVRANVNQVRKVNLYLDCEPLMDKKIAEKIKRFKEAGVTIVNIACNASMLTEKRAKELLDAGLDEIYISIDSLKKEVFEEIRKRLQFERVYENTIGLIRLRNKVSSPLSIRIQMVQQDLNDSEVDKFVSHWSPLMASQDKVVVHKAHNWGGQLDVGKSTEDKKINDLPCTILWSNACIHSDGSVALCSVDTVASSQHSIGSLTKSTLKEIWQGFEVNQIRQRHLNQQRQGHSLCDGCTAWREVKNTKYISPTG